MRTLKFIVTGQAIEADPKCDFTGLIPGTEGYLRAEFSFSPEWDGYKKVAAFYSNLGREYEPQVLSNGRFCMIPNEALKRSIFKVKVIGVKGDTRIQTGKLTVHQKGGNS